jgi:hypothetical protein
VTFLFTVDEACLAYLEALDLLERGDVAGGISAALHYMSAFESTRERHERAMRLFGSAGAINESVGRGCPAARPRPTGEYPTGERSPFSLAPDA